MSRELLPYQRAESSLLKEFRKTLWAPFLTAINTYRLLSPGDRVAVCVSGGKDSMLMAKLMQELQRHTDFPFELVFLVMDPGYTSANRARIEENAELLRIPVRFFETDVFASTEQAVRSPCYLCARMRRGHLYSQAQQLGCNKIALGHHRNDVIETTVLALFYGGQLQAMPPKLRSQNFPGMELIRPLYCIREADIVAWQTANNLRFIQCACRVTEREKVETGASKRQEIKHILAQLSESNPNVENSIFHAIHNVAIDTMAGVKSHGRLADFNELFANR